MSFPSDHNELGAMEDTDPQANLLSQAQGPTPVESDRQNFIRAFWELGQQVNTLTQTQTMLQTALDSLTQ